MVNNNCYKAGKTHVPKGVMVHSTGANNPTLRRYLAPDDGDIGQNQYNNHWNQPTPSGRSVCVHAFIGKDKNNIARCYQTLPWTIAGWHSGSGSKGRSENANNTGYIGFEICEDGLTDKKYFDEVYGLAVGLTAHLCKEYKLPVNTATIIGHFEGNRLGIASNHADPQHWFTKHGKSMNTFRSDVKKELDKLFIIEEVVNLTGRVNVTTSLNVRSGAGTSFAAIGKLTDNDPVEIVAKSGVWLKIKHNKGFGYVHGDFVTIDEPKFDLEKDVYRVYVDGTSIIALTGITKATEYANKQSGNVYIESIRTGKKTTIKDGKAEVIIPKPEPKPVPKPVDPNIKIIEDLNKEIATLNGQNNGLTMQNSILNGEIKSLKAQIAALKNQVIEKDKDIATRNTTIEGLNGQLATLNDTIKKVSDAMSFLNSLK